jgi:hypothetical protein
MREKLFTDADNKNDDATVATINKKVQETIEREVQKLMDIEIKKHEVEMQQPGAVPNSAKYL